MHFLECFSAEHRRRRRRAFDSAFGRHDEVATPEKPLADRLVQAKDPSVTTARPGTEAHLRLTKSLFIADLRHSIVIEGLSDEETESLLNILARDLLPNHYLCKVKKICGR